MKDAVKAGPSTQQVPRQRDSDSPHSWQHRGGQRCPWAPARAAGNAGGRVQEKGFGLPWSQGVLWMSPQAGMGFPPKEMM